jgi:hypothetical protein
MVHDEQWPVARLIPISSATGVEAQERRLASALLAVMQAVPEFARALLKPLGAPAGRVESFIEVPLKFGDRTVRPDGIITVARGTKTWGALVEAKTAANPLESAQMNTYLDLAPANSTLRPCCPSRTSTYPHPPSTPSRSSAASSSTSLSITGLGPTFSPKRSCKPSTEESVIRTRPTE